MLRLPTALLLAVFISACSTVGTTPATGPNPSAPADTLPSPKEDTSARVEDSATDTLADPARSTLPEVTPSTTTTTLPESVTQPPVWIGTRVLPLRNDGFGEIQPTPPEMIDRRFTTVDLLPAPDSDAFEWTIEPVPEDVLARSSWTPDCPVAVEDLSYLTVSFWGFDEKPHTGEMIVNASYDEELVGVFRTLYEARFPIEEMRVIRLDEIDAPPTGDGNVTGVLECRDASGGTSWSMHAYGLAIDVNPFHNPYLKRDVVLPELATAYTDRARDLPGMIRDGDVVVRAFAEIGWAWGGNWTSLKDWMHFSSNGR